MVWALPRSLATTNGIDSLSFPAVTEMFHFAACRFSHSMYSSGNDTDYSVPGFPIRKSSDQSVRAAPRSFSQLAASFIA
jgi:hypothetical protein